MNVTSRNQEVQALYENLIDAWNQRDARGMAALFGEEGVQIGFDGSMAIGQEEIESHLAPIFENHPTAPYVKKVKDIRFFRNERCFFTCNRRHGATWKVGY